MNATEPENPRLLEAIRWQQSAAYAEVYAAMRARHEAVARGAASNALFLVEHRPVITLGRNTEPSQLLHTPDELSARGIDVVEADRGGGATWHGPGQLTAYPVLDLGQWRRSMHWYLRTLEEALLRQLAGYGLSATRIPGLTGVWVDGAKVAAIGIGVRKWVTYHGIALNVAPDLAQFRLIVPCGIAGRPVTSLEVLLGNRAPTLEAASADFEAAFRECFELPSTPADAL